jgi:hypothetical protein
MAVTGSSFITEAAKWIGTPYVWGGSSPSGFDCSGLVAWSLEQIGVKNVPRTSEEQWAWVDRISASQLQPGDLIFENWPGEASPGHVAIYAGNNQIIQAPAPGQNVQKVPWSPGQAQAQGATVVGYGRVPGVSYSGVTAPASGNGTQDATLTAFNPGDINWAAGPAGIIEGAAQAVANMFTSGVTGGVSTATGISGVWQALTAIGTDLNAMMKSVEWLFVPGHWIRIICFGNGVVLALLGMRSLSRASTEDTALATGILLTVLSGVFLFIAFHNLPDDVTDLQSLLGHISAGIRHQPQSATTTATTL